MKREITLTDYEAALMFGLNPSHKADGPQRLRKRGLHFDHPITLEAVEKELKNYNPEKSTKCWLECGHYTFRYVLKVPMRSWCWHCKNYQLVLRYEKGRKRK